MGKELHRLLDLLGLEKIEKGVSRTERRFGTTPAIRGSIDRPSAVRR